ncbi:MAG: VanZ family protein [Erysipelotrichales bacterium]|nr:VanZ family protein [Erysipelotrichales bacterium]
MKKIISIILLISWMSLIFSFSNKNGEESGSMSAKLIRGVVLVFTDIKDEERIENIIDKYSFVVRKSAHFFEYFVLGILVINVLISFGKYKHLFIYASLFCIFYAITDECHQLFIDNRSGQISDVLLDSSAGIISSFLLSKLYVIRGKYGKKNN